VRSEGVGRIGDGLVDDAVELLVIEGTPDQAVRDASLCRDVRHGTTMRERVEAVFAVVRTRSGVARTAERCIQQQCVPDAVVPRDAAAVRVIEEPVELGVVFAVPVGAQRRGAAGDVVDDFLRIVVDVDRQNRAEDLFAGDASVVRNVEQNRRSDPSGRPVRQRTQLALWCHDDRSRTVRYRGRFDDRP
jgi:hypothetical protein